MDCHIIMRTLYKIRQIIMGNLLTDWFKVNLITLNRGNIMI